VASGNKRQAQVSDMAKAGKPDNELYERNLKAFQKHLPYVHQHLKSHARPAAGDAQHADAENKIDDFLASPVLLDLAIGPPGKDSLDRYGIPVANAMRDLATTEKQVLSPAVVDGENFYLFIFGVEPGLDIQRLVDHFDPVVVMIFEPDLDNLARSMQSFDWHAHLEKQVELGKSTYVFINPEPELALVNVQTVVQNTSPASYGGNPCFVYRESPLFGTILDYMKKYASFILALGFMYDETLMMKNTYLNLHGHDNRILVQSDGETFPTPVFVVGAGPSLDADLPFIKANAERAIIVSTGTALRSLLVNGITPDFQVEMENLHVYSSIKKLADEYDLSQICLVGSTSIDHHIVKFFKKIAYFYRPQTSPYPLLCTSPKQTLNNAAPLVVNVSFSLAIDIGAEEIYLFGTDFGSRGGGPDHARDNVAFTEGAMQGYVRDYHTEVPANFDGKIYASTDFISGLKVMHEAISSCAPGRRFYNCSDGARVEGAQPKRSADIMLTGTAAQKARDLGTVFGRNAVLTQKEFDLRWNRKNLAAGINQFCDLALRVFGKPESYLDNQYLRAFTVASRRSPNYIRIREATLENDAADSVSVMLRGTFDYLLLGIRYYLGSTDDPDFRARLAKVIATEMASTIEMMRTDAMSVLETPEDIPPPKEGGDWDEKDFVQEATYTWGNVSRNAPCPCGSGKRYKHCHGATA
jgi:hypothetical protein